MPTNSHIGSILDAVLVDDQEHLDIEVLTRKWALQSAARGDGATVLYDVIEGNMLCSPEQFITEFEQLFSEPVSGRGYTARCIRHMLHHLPFTQSLHYVIPGGLARLYLDHNAEHGNVELATTDKVAHRLVEDWATARTSNSVRENSVYTVTQHNSRFTPHFLDFAGTPLVRENYTPDQLKKYDYVVEELNKKDPAGRIVILDGPPGTGKTYAVRALIHDVKDSLFLVLPQGMVEQLVGPNMLPMLLDMRDDADGDPTRIVFVLEDADDALVPRDSGNVGLISALLNFGDGILGTALNVRIVATTNQPLSKIDRAILRPGRLISHLHLGALTEAEASAVLARLNPDAELPSKKSSRIGFANEGTEPRWTLAEVYEAARARSQ